MSDDEQQKPPAAGQTCPHHHFAASVNVNVVTDSTEWYADVVVVCSDCRLPFRFLGLPGGFIRGGAAVSADGLEARLAIAPGPVEPDSTLKPN